MALDKMFDSIEGLRGTACADATLGEPEAFEGKVLIPVAAVSTGFGLGFGRSGVTEQEEDDSSADTGGGAGGSAKARPLAIIEVTAADTVVRPVVDETKIALAGIAMGAWVIFWVGATVRAIFGKRPA